MIKLPLWRLILGIAVLGGLAAVLLALAPVYLDNYRLGRYLQVLAADPRTATTPDETLRSEVVARSHELDLPVAPGDVQIAHSGGRLQVQTKYRVQMDLVLYPVDLHFHPAASSR